MGLQKLAYAELRVNDLDKTLDFNKKVMGLSEVERQGEKVYLGCGFDENFDLAVAPGGTGVACFAFQAESEDDLTYYQRRLKESGVSSEMRSDSKPGVLKALHFTLPSGHDMELALVKDRPLYLHPSVAKIAPQFQGVSPLDVDHITLRAKEVKPLAEFLKHALDFKISDAFQPAAGVWGAAWTRVGEYHHDLAIIQAQREGETLDHLAWMMDGIDHTKRAVDYLSKYGLPLETGLGRHGVGGNLYAYFWAPGGNRYELSSEMPRCVIPDAPPNIWDNFPKAFSAWGAQPPESFAQGS